MTDARPSHVCPSAFALAQIHTGELQGPKAEAILRHQEGCSSCQARLQAQRRAFHDLRQEDFFLRLLDEGSTLERPTPASPTDRRPLSSSSDLWRFLRTTFSWQGVGVAAFASFWILLFIAPLPSAPSENAATTKTGQPVGHPYELSLSKGQPAGRPYEPLLSPAGRPYEPLLSPAGRPYELPSRQGWLAKSGQPLFRILHLPEGGKQSRFAEHGQPLAPGDLIQFSYHLPQDSHLMILAIHEKGGITVAFPYPGKASQRLEKGVGHLPKDSSLELDDDLGIEIYLFLSSPKPFTLADIEPLLKQALLAAKGRLLHLDLSSLPLHVQRFWIEKRPRLRNAP